MNLAYLDCLSGISGDMTLGALVDAGVDIEALNSAIGSLGLPGCHLVAREVRKGGFRATQVEVRHEPEHHERHLDEILSRIDASILTDRQKETAGALFQRLGEAEARVHGIPIENVHFHELGAADSVADIVGTAVGFDLLGVDRVVASPVPTGTGTIRIAHGRASVPAPATAELLRGIPLAESTVEAELTTPTGAVILATLVERFGSLPSMTIDRIGCGAGSRDLEGQANVLRLFLGTTSAGTETPERVWVLETNLDDISGEMIGYCTTRLAEAGALDVFTTAIQMKKNRPGTKLTVLCGPADVDSLEAMIFQETTTLGIRRWAADRHVLARQRHGVQTSWGPIEGKIGWLTDGTPRFSPEYESCRAIAAERGVALHAVYEAARRAFDPATVRRDDSSADDC